MTAIIPLELDADHQAQAAHIADLAIARLHCHQLSLEDFTDKCGVLDQALFQQLNGRQRRGARHWVAAESAAVRAARPGADLVTRDHSAKRHATGNSFCRAENVWLNAPMFAGEHSAGTAEAGLNLIEHQENAVFSAKFLEHRQVFRRWYHVSALTLDRFDKDCRHFFRPHLVAKQHLLQHTDALDTTGRMFQLVGATVTKAVGYVMHAGNERSEMGAMGRAAGSQ